MKKNLFLLSLTIQVILIFIAFSVLLNGCSCIPHSENKESNIPADVLKKADQFIISKTGADFFNEYIIIDNSQTKQITPYFLMVYKLYMPEKRFVDELIKFNVDSTGLVLNQAEVVGIPDCNSNPMDCDFIVDEMIARQIAAQNGLVMGIKEWNIDFVWDAKYKKYVWQILCTTAENKGEHGYKGEGEKIIIDANDASVLSKNTWKIN